VKPGAASKDHFPAWAGWLDGLATVLLGLAAWSALVGSLRLSIGGVVVLSVGQWRRPVIQAAIVIIIRYLIVRQPGLHWRLATGAASYIKPAGLAVLVPFLIYAVIVARGYDGVTYLRGDCIYYYQTALSIIQDGDLDLANQLHNWRGHAHQVAWSKDGRVVPKHPIFLSIVSAPVVELGGMPGALVFNLLQFGALLAVLYRLAARVAAPVPAAWGAALTGVATWLPHYVYNYSPDVFASFWLAAAFAALPETEGSRPRLGRHLLAGLLAGCAAISKYPLALFMPGMVLLIRPLSWSRTCAFVAGWALPVVLLLGLNFHLFGSPLASGYDRILVINPGGNIGTYSQRGSFSLDPVEGMRGQLFDGSHGLLTTSPVTLLSFVGLPFLARRRRLLAWVLGIGSVTLFLVYSTYDNWNASHYGNRFLIPIAVLAVVPLASLLDAASRWWRPSRRGARLPLDNRPPA
jgi:hypothetical protein